LGEETAREKMNSEWAKEQNDFLEKQKERQRHAAGATVQKSLQPKAGRAVPKFTDSYTRDPNALFRSDDGSKMQFPPPMNHNTQGLGGKQPVKYTKIVLAIKMGQFPKDTPFEVATVDFRTGQVQLFHTENEWRQGMSAFDDVVRVPGKKFNNSYYKVQILAFLERGHSLLEPHCRCTHNYGEERARELGISMNKSRNGVEDKMSIRGGECTIPKTRVPRTAQELAQEIAVGDLWSIVDQRGERLVDTLANNPKIAVLEPDAKQHFRFAYRATFDKVQNKQELLMHIDSVDLCLKEPTDRDMYNGVKSDLEALAEEGLIYSLYNAEARAAVIFPRRKQLEFPVDDDIKALWRENPPPKLSRVSHDEFERLLRAEGLVPTKQAAPTKDSGKKDQKKRRKRQRKSNPHAHLTLTKS